MAEIYPIALLADDPTQKAMIGWLDHRYAADGGQHTIHFGTDPNNLSGSVSVAGDAFPSPGDDGYYYVAEINGLSAGTEYHAEINYGDGIKGLPPFETLPSSLGEVKIAVLSDTHTDADHSMSEPEMMEPIADKKPDLMMYVGDWQNFASGVNQDNTDEWVRIFRDYFACLFKDRLIPIFSIAGNHEVGNHNWDGADSGVNPGAAYFQFIFKNTKEMAPVGENYGQITISDYLQLIGLDSHSAFPIDAGDFFEVNHNPNVKYCIMFMHSPLFGGGFRSDADDRLQNNLRNELVQKLNDADNVLATFGGHIHVHKSTFPWKLVDQLPSYAIEDNIPLESGKFIVKDLANPRIVEFGDGYSNMRSINNRWYNNTSSSFVKQFYIVTLTDEMFFVEICDEHGDVFETYDLTRMIRKRKKTMIYYNFLQSKERV